MVYLYKIVLKSIQSREATMNLILENWDETLYKNFLNHLKSFQDLGYKKFHEGLVPGKDNIIGIRSPISKQIGKEIAKGNWRSFLDVSKSDFYEEIFIRGIVIGLAKTEYDEFIYLVDNYLDYIDNWAICDGFSCGLKQSKKFSEPFFNHIQGFLTSKNPWHIRTGIIIMLSHYLDSLHINEVIALCDSVHDEEYYVRMGQAWLLSVCYIKFPEQTLEYLLNNSTLDNWTYNKSISKITESRRVVPEIKEYLKTLKRR